MADSLDHAIDVLDHEAPDAAQAVRELLTANQRVRDAAASLQAERDTAREHCQALAEQLRVEREHRRVLATDSGDPLKVAACTGRLEAIDSALHQAERAGVLE